MSKSRKRVARAIEAAGLAAPIHEMEGDCTTAAAAAATLGVEVDRIAKSILLVGQESGSVFLFLTAGTGSVDPERAATVAGEPLARPDAAQVRATTGFAIGGVSPLGHLCEVTAFIDPYLARFPTVWAAAGTPRHVFEATPEDLARATHANQADFTTPR